jgi:hypothetical protein
MTRRYRGSFITANPPVPAGSTEISTAGGIWSMAYQMQYRQAGLWPIAGVSGDGTFAIFALGLSTTRNKYTYASCVATSATASTCNSSGGSAAGNTTFGIFALGNNNTARNKYTYTGDVVSSATAASRASLYGAAAGNNTVGLFSLGARYCCCFGYVGTNTRNLYTYAGDTSTVFSAGGQSLYQSGTGNSTVGIFAYGVLCCSTTAARFKYLYAYGILSSATSATLCTSRGAAAGNSTVGIFALGYGPCVGYVTTRDKYTYATDVVTTATAATFTSCFPSAAGNSTRGIFSRGSCTSSTNRYTYSNDTVVAGGALTGASRVGSAASNGIANVNT